MYNYMIESEGVLRRWGNSYGIVIPKEIAEKEKIKEDDKVKFIIFKDREILKKSFGSLKIKRSGQGIKDQTRKELYD